MDLARCLYELAVLVEVEPSVRSGLKRWHSCDLDEPDAGVLRGVARRLTLGAPLSAALDPLVGAAGPDAGALVETITAHQLSGASLATSLRGIAGAIEARRALEHEGRAAGAAAKLSGRLLGLLALGSLIVGPLSNPMTPAALLLTTSVACGLAWIGIRWMRRLSPEPPVADDPVATMADELAALVRAGVQPHAALDLTTTSLGPARRRVRLGMSWPDAIRSAGDIRHVRLAAVVERGLRDGIPIADALTALAAGIREGQRRAFELKARRAPVLLVAPLTLCLLPAFAIVVVVPLLRGLTV